MLRSMISEIEKELDTINILRTEMKEITSIDPILYSDGQRGQYSMIFIRAVKGFLKE